MAPIGEKRLDQRIPTITVEMILGRKTIN